MLLIAAGSLWLFLAAIPALADGGPHVASANSGASTLTSDSCAGCHRAHTAQGPLLLAASSEEALCLSCHGQAGTGATTNVERGVQYALGTSGQVRTTTVLGALRGGGFVAARIDHANPTRVAYLSGSSVRQNAKVGVLDVGFQTTSAHLDINNPGTLGTAWGNIAGTPGVTFSATANPGGTMELSCASCHNPHGNSSYRILNPIPSIGGGTAVAPTVGVTVADAPPPAANDSRNYTVIQVKGTEGTDSTYLLYASQLTGYTMTQGDYFHRKVPWNAVTSATAANDAPNGKPSTFDLQINQWCAQCHSRYLAVTGTPFDTDSGDAIFTYRHSNTSNKPCTTCHVAHGSNAAMTGTYSANYLYPDGIVRPNRVGDSRLLKVDNRGTCQMCHDPTATITAGTWLGPTPNPMLP
jgi:predicted CXXCH cytochrome family protein